MPLQKSAVVINFQQGMQTGADPYQIPVGKFEELSNSVFDTVGRLTKRNGFGLFTSLPDRTTSFVTTFKNNLTAIGPDLKSFSQGNGLWFKKGSIYPVEVSTLPLIRNSTNQTQGDAAMSSNGLVCTAYVDSISSGSGVQDVLKYAVADATTGLNIVRPTTIVSQQGSVRFAPKVFSLSNYFVVAFTTTSASADRLQYISISAATPTVVGSVTDITVSYSANSKGAFDGVVANNSLYFSWNGIGSTGIQTAYLTSNFTQSGAVTISSTAAQIVSMTSDVSGPTPVLWTTGWQTSVGSLSGSIVVAATNQALTPLFSKTQSTSSGGAEVVNIAPVAQNGVAKIYYETKKTYDYVTSSSAFTDYISAFTSTQTGSLTAASVVVRGVGLGSKAFLIGSDSYFLSTYQSSFQSTYFLLNSTGGVVSKLAYSNGSGYKTQGLPSVSVSNNTAQIPYLIKEQIEAANKDTNIPSGTQINGIYSQQGINLVKYTFGTQGLVANELGNNLNLTGGLLWGFDGYQTTENGFNLYPDSVQVTSSATGSMSAQTYFYQATYEWSDNQGNVFRSAPSVPVSLVLSSASTAVVVSVPTLRLTYKTQNPAKIVIYRWSTAQQTYYQTTSIDQPVLNNTSVDSITFIDRNSDATILGNNILYTTGGVVENIGGPAAVATTIFDSRLWLIDAENQDTLWYSKQVVQNTPVEMSDLFTLYITPTASAQGPTGPMTCLAAMDDKLIIFKKNSIFYVSGTGPDNTGANSQYSQPIFITATVGCDNQDSIVVTPNGIMFQSDKGIWLLGRDLSTNYVGKPVQRFNSVEVVSAVTVPGTNQVRFTMENNLTLLYDYFVDQWGTFTGIPGISSTLYQNMHTFVNSRGEVYQETPGVYLDGSTPVVMNFKTGWLNLAGLQGYQRAYKMYMLGTYQTPHRVTLGVAYDFDSSINQQSTLLPKNFSGVWGSGTSWGSIATWGGSSNVEQWQFNFQKQQCQTFQVTFNEYYDSSMGLAAGAGLTVSGLTIVSGFKKGYPGNLSPFNRIG